MKKGKEMPRAVEYSYPEGAAWQALPPEVYITSIEMSDFVPGDYTSNVFPYRSVSGAELTVVYHALKFDSGEVWDCINGFRGR